MNFLRNLLSLLVWAAVLGVIVLIAAFVPAIQTWVAGLVLDNSSTVHGTVGDIAAAFGKAETDNLHLQFPGGELAAPKIEAELPLLNAVGRRKFHFRHLTAKGWTLTIHPAPDADPQAPTEPPEVTLARAVAALLNGGALPYEIEVDQAELEGDVIIAGAKGKTPGRIHVALNGGGLSAGHQADFAIDAAGSLADPNLPLFALSTHGHLLVTLGDSRVLSRVELQAGLAAKGAALDQDLQLVGDLAATRGQGAVVYSVDLTSRGRRFLDLQAHLAEKTGEITGTWKVDLRETDFAVFFTNHDLPVGSAVGEGRFEASPAELRVRAIGALKIGARHLEALAPALERVGTLSFDTTFDVTHHAHSLRVDQFAATATGTRPLGSMKIRQAFIVDETTWDYKPADPKGDWAEASVQGIPLAWLTTELAHGLTISGGDLAGSWIVKTVPGGFFLTSLTPVTAQGVALQWNGAPVISNLTLSALGNATHTDAGWQVQLTPLAISRGGAVLGHVTAHFTPAGPDEAMNKVTGKWDLDIAALLPYVAPETREWLGAARSASADFTGNVGQGMLLDSNLTVIAAAPDTTLTAIAMHTELGADGSSSFTVPLKIKAGDVQSDLAIEGTWSGALSGSRLRLKLFGGTVVAAQVQGIAAWWAKRLIPTWDEARPSGQTPPRSASAAPFWGKGSGRIMFSCEHFKLADREYKDVSGAFEYDPTGLALEEGNLRFGEHNIEGATGKLAFDPAAAVPYELKAKASLGQVQASTFLPKPPHDDDPQVEGKFTVDAALASSGHNLAELRENLREIFQIDSKSGIVRFLKISVADVIPQHGTTVGDTLGGVGNTVGSLLGMQGKIGSGKNPVTPAAQTMIDFSYDVAEIGYDQFSLTAVRQPDGTVQLHDIKLVAPDETLTGSGSLTAQAGKGLTAWPLSLDWDLSFRGPSAELLAKDGLIVYKKDAKAYVPLKPRIHVGGTLEHPDLTQWHDILAKAASAVPPKK